MKKKRKWKDDSTESQIAKELLDNYNYEFYYKYSKAKDRKAKDMEAPHDADPKI